MRRIVVACILYSCFLRLQAAPIVPEDVLSPDEISDIISSGNVFFRNSNHPAPGEWDRWQRRYSDHFLGNRDQFFSKNEVIQKTMSDGFPIRYKIEELYRAGMNQHIAWGAVTPRVSITLGQGAAPVNLNNMFLNLFGFLMPQHWMLLAGRHKAYKATKFLFLKTALDEVLNAELQYLKVHKSIQDFEIINFYFIHLQLLGRIYPDMARELQTLRARFANEGTAMALKRGETKLGFDALAEVMALEKGEQGDYSVGKINIANLDNFPTEVRAVHRLRPEFQDKERFVRTAVSRSVELRSIKEFYKIAQLNIGVTAFGTIFENADANRNTGNQARFGISAGYDTLPRILNAVSDKRTAKIDVQSEYFKILNLARRFHDLYTNSLGLFTESVRSMQLSKEAFLTNLSHILDEHRPVDGVFLFSFIQLLDAELKMNTAFHRSLEAEAMLKRLLVSSESEVLDYLPSRSEVRTIRTFFSRNYHPVTNALSAASFTARTIRKTSQLRRFLAGEATGPDGKTIRLNDEELHDSIRLNASWLLASRWNFAKSRKFYKTLYRYIKKNNIRLTDFEMRTLHKKSHSLSKRWFSKKYKNEKEVFQDNFAFSHFGN